MIFSAYRRDDFADPDSFLLQLGVVLEIYDDEVIRRVSDPRTGIQRRIKFPPSIAEVVEACEAEATTIATRLRLAAIPKPKPRALIDAPIDRPPGHLANLFVPSTSQRFAGLVEMAARSEPKYSRYDAGGIWVPLGWYDEQEAVKTEPRRFTMDDLAAIYQRHDATEAPATE